MIVDASVAFKWIAQEEGSDAAFALLAEDVLIAPTLLLSEIGNALWKKALREEIDPAVSFEDDLASVSALVSIREEAAVVPRALTIARALSHPIYDCVYLAMAEVEKMPLVTADKRFIRATSDSEWASLVRIL